MEVFDLAKFRDVPSCKNAMRGHGAGVSACSQGKAGLALGLVNENMTPSEVTQRIVNYRRTLDSSSAELWQKIQLINDEEFYEEADALMLKWAVESGRYTFTNAVLDPVSELQFI